VRLRPDLLSDEIAERMAFQLMSEEVTPVTMTFERPSTNYVVENVYRLLVKAKRGQEVCEGLWDDAYELAVAQVGKYALSQKESTAMAMVATAARFDVSGVVTFSDHFWGLELDYKPDENYSAQKMTGRLIELVAAGRLEQRTAKRELVAA
jgi:hypothetical protein